MAKKAVAVKPQAIDLTNGAETDESGALLESPADDTGAEEQDSGEADSGEVVLERTLGWTAESRTLKHESTGIELDIASIAPAGLLYLIRLGYTTSLTQVNAGKASEAEGDTKNPATPFYKRAAARADRIMHGTVRGGGGNGGNSASPRDADTKLLHTLAWAAIQRSNKKRGLPDAKGTDKPLAIARFLLTPAGAAVAQQAEAMAALDLD